MIACIYNCCFICNALIIDERKMSILLDNFILLLEMVNSQPSFFFLFFLWLLNHKVSREEYKGNLKRLC